MEDYFASHRGSIESAVSRAIEATLNAEPTDPILFLSEHLLGGVLTGDDETGKSLRQVQASLRQAQTRVSATLDPAESLHKVVRASQAAADATREVLKSLEATKVPEGSKSSSGSALKVAYTARHSSSDSSWRTTSWLDSIGVVEQIASTLLSQHCSPATDELAAIRALCSAATSESDLADVLRAGGTIEAIAKTIYPALQELSRAQAATGAELHERFVQDGASFTMRYGDLSTFFGGLEAKIGAPSPNVQLAMEEEHVAASDSHDEFTTSNYEVTTTPEIEWRFVVEATDRRLPEGLEWPMEQKLRGIPERMRQPMPPTTLRARLDDVNRQLVATGEPPLMPEEGFAARLYTGPMYVKYNDLLRGFGPALAGCKDNRYVTTSHAINSAIVKSSKLTSAQCVYRGVAGGVLPESFWVPNAQGVRGGIEGAFLSTTFDRSVAMHYASIPGKPAIIFELQMGMIDRGAELGWISQCVALRSFQAPRTPIERARASRPPRLPDFSRPVCRAAGTLMSASASGPR